MQIHFIAIGGSAMHNLAMALQDKGYLVTGSDDEIFEPSYSRLKNRGLLPEKMGWDASKIHKDLDAIILGMHARSNNPELIEAQRLGLRIYSYPEFLFEQSKTKKRVVIAGSHGKTTITSMILHVLKYAQLDVDYMVGAQLEGFDVMVKLTEEASIIIMEGDEYLTSPIDRRPKFLHYHPHIAVLSGIGWDHINVFPEFEQYLDQFRQLLRQMEPDGKLFYFKADEEVQKLVSDFRGTAIPYEVHRSRVEESTTVLLDENLQGYPIQVFGKHNLANISAAKAICNELGVGDIQFYEAMADFAGASKRMEKLAETDYHILFRDFAHAPSKLYASVEAIKAQYPDHKLIVCFELHTFSSMSENFLDHYKHALDKADAAAVFYDPHAVSLKRLPLLSNARIIQGFGRDLTILHQADELVAFVSKEFDTKTVIALMSSGNFAGLDMQEITRLLGK